jgi:hypothetical protein
MNLPVPRRRRRRRRRLAVLRWQLLVLLNGLPFAEARFFSFLNCLLNGLFDGDCTWKSMAVKMRCPLPRAASALNKRDEIVCPAEYQPVVCKYRCVYSNRCQAYRAGYDFDEYCWGQDPDDYTP